MIGLILAASGLLLNGQPQDVNAQERVTLQDGRSVPVPACLNGKKDCEPWERDWDSVRIKPKPNPFDRFDPPPPRPEHLGPGPHILVISDGNAATRIDYRSGPACQRARDAVRRQVAPPKSTGPVEAIYGPPGTTAFCVPR